MKNDFENEIVTVEEQGDYKVFYNFKGEELLRVKNDFYPWLREHFTASLVGALEMSKINLDNVSEIIENQLIVSKRG